MRNLLVALLPLVVGLASAAPASLGIIDPADSLEKEARAWLLRKQTGDTDESQTADQVISKHEGRISDLIARDTGDATPLVNSLAVDPSDRLEMEARAWQIRKRLGFPAAYDVMSADEILAKHNEGAPGGQQQGSPM